MTKLRRSMFLCGLIILFAFPILVSASEQSLEFLLETDASYELNIKYPGQLDAIPPKLSIYTYDENGAWLNSGRIYKGILYEGMVETSLVLDLPRGHSRAVAILVSEDDLQNSSLEIERLDRFNIADSTSLAQLLVNEHVYTGLVVDARGLDLERGMSPRIWSESGDLIYGGVAAKYEFVQDEGVISYGTNLSTELMKRVSMPGKLSYTSPLVVEAKATRGMPSTGVVISQAEADIILTSIKNYDFFAHYAVVFLID